MPDNSHSGRCRNCGYTGALDELGFVGEVAPFFLKRVLGIRLGNVQSSRAWKQWVRSTIRRIQTPLEKLDKRVVLIEMQMCSRCSFIQTKLPFQEEAINRLYVDYREESYNRERIEMEPYYVNWVSQVGQSPVELETRLTAASAFLRPHISGGEDFTILDYGGSDGKFMPRIPGRKYVFEISNVEPVAGVTRIHSEAELGTYGLVQLAHVVEHVVEPLALIKHVAARVAQGGFLYIETPEEISHPERADLKAGRRRVGIHEHINSYCVGAVTGLVESAGLRLVDIEATPVDVGWGKAVHIRALGQKN